MNWDHQQCKEVVPGGVHGYGCGCLSSGSRADGKGGSEGVGAGCL